MYIDSTYTSGQQADPPTTDSVAPLGRLGHRPRVTNCFAGCWSGLVNSSRRGYINLSTYEGVGARRYTLLPRLVVGGAGLVTIWNDGSASLQFWRSVFEKRAPDFIERVEDLAGDPDW